MISTCRKVRNEKGAALLVITIILLVISSLIIAFSSNYGILQNKIASNMTRNIQAFEAAEGGLEFAINYLKTNSSTVLANPVGGYINYSDSNTTNITLANGAKFTVVYTNIIANNYKQILITSTGTSDDGTATRVVKQLVYGLPILVNLPTYTLTTKTTSPTTLMHIATLTNTTTDKNIQTGNIVFLWDSARTIYSTGMSNSSQIGPDIQQNVSSLQTMSNDDFFISYFGRTPATVQALANYYYTCNSAGPSTDLCPAIRNLTGVLIWVKASGCGGGGSYILNSCTIGSAASPVIIIVEGTMSIGASTTVYGFIYGNTPATSGGRLILQGAEAIPSFTTLANNYSYTYNLPVLTAAQNIMAGWAKVPGTWRDY